MRSKHIQRVPLVGPALVGAVRLARQRSFPGSGDFWERHYARGGNSGEGSAGKLAAFKADVLNGFVAAHDVQSVIEFGCGDGAQLRLADYPTYLGLDISATTLRHTMNLFAHDLTKGFMGYDPHRFRDPAGLVTADLALSLDVIYHLVEDDVYHLHLGHIFGAARRFVILFTSDAETLTAAERFAPHVRHRPVQRDVAQHFPQWRLRQRIANRHPYQGAATVTSFADFFIYEPVGSTSMAHTCAVSAE